MVFDTQVDAVLTENLLGDRATGCAGLFERLAPTRITSILVDSPCPGIVPTKRVKIVKRITAREIFHRVPAVKKPLWGGALWSTGDCISPVGRHGHEAAIRQYVKKQGQEHRVSAFGLSGEDL